MVEDHVVRYWIKHTDMHRLHWHRQRISALTFQQRAPRYWVGMDIDLRLSSASLITSDQTRLLLCLSSDHVVINISIIKKTLFRFMILRALRLVLKDCKTYYWPKEVRSVWEGEKKPRKACTYVKVWPTQVAYCVTVLAAHGTFLFESLPRPWRKAWIIGRSR